MKININLPALYTQKTYQRNITNLSGSLKRLSSGFRINEAADDAAGMSISEKMKRSIRGMKKARQNTLDGVSFIQTFEGALDEIHAMLQRMRELSVQGASETYKNQDRTNIQKEIKELREQVDKISKFTQFNDVHLLKPDNLIEYGEKDSGGKHSKKTEDYYFQTGGEQQEHIKTDISDHRADSSTLGLPIMESNGDKLNFYKEIPIYGAFKDLNGDGNKDEKDIPNKIPKREYLVAKDTDNNGVIDHGELTTQFPWLAGKIPPTAEIRDTNGYGNADAKDHVLFAKVPTLGDSNDEYKENKYFYKTPSGERRYFNDGIGKIMERIVGNNESTPIEDVTKGFMEGEYRDSLNLTQAEFDALKAAYNSTAGTPPTLPPNPTEAQITAYNTAFQNHYQHIIGVINNHRLEKRFNWIKGASEAHTGVFDGTGKEVMRKTNDLAEFLKNKMKEMNDDTNNATKVAKYKEKVEDILEDGKGKVAFNESIKSIDLAISTISESRAKLGAIQNRLESIIRNTDTSIENLTESRSRIFDADMAEEFSEYTKNKVLQESSTAMIGHANQMPQAVLKLLDR